jgi:hypothetical protein
VTALYQLAEEYRRLKDALDEGADVGELMAAIEDALEVKAANICRLLVQWEGDAEVAKREADRLYDRHKALQNRAERLRDYLRENMTAAGINKIESPLFSVSLSAGKPKVVITDEGKIPPGFWREKTTRAPDKVAILDAHESLGECVPGTEIVPTTTLRVK